MSSSPIRSSPGFKIFLCTLFAKKRIFPVSREYFISFPELFFCSMRKVPFRSFFEAIQKRFQRVTANETSIGYSSEIRNCHESCGSAGAGCSQLCIADDFFFAHGVDLRDETEVSRAHFVGQDIGAKKMLQWTPFVPSRL